MIGIEYQLVILISSISALVGSIGLFRFKDCYTRIHAATMISVGGAILSLVALSLSQNWNIYSVKVLTVAIFLIMTNPVTSHVIISMAKRSGIRPYHRTPKHAVGGNHS